MSQQQAAFAIQYKQKHIGEGRIDLLVDETLIVELKAVEHLLPIHSAQVISYLKATGQKTALLINFNTPVMKDGVKRISL